MLDLMVETFCVGLRQESKKANRMTNMEEEEEEDEEEEEETEDQPVKVKEDEE